jgi:hypothetical protein
MSRVACRVRRDECWTPEQIEARSRHFPGSWNHNLDLAWRIPRELKPFYRVLYSDANQLYLAKSVEPKYAIVEYRYNGLRNDEMQRCEISALKEIRKEVSIETITQADKDATWWDKNWTKYLGTKHTGKHVAIHKQDIIESADDIGELLSLINKRGRSLSDCYIAYLPKDRVNIFPDKTIEAISG